MKSLFPEIYIYAIGARRDGPLGPHELINVLAQEGWISASKGGNGGLMITSTSGGGGALIDRFHLNGNLVSS